MSSYYFVKSRKLSIYDTHNFLRISWQLLMCSRAVKWHPAYYFVTSFCDNWQLCGGWKIVSKRFVDDSVKIFDQKWQLCDSYRVVLWWLCDKHLWRDNYTTTLWQPYKSSYDDLMTIPCHVTTQWQLLTLKTKDHQFGKFAVTSGTVICHNDNLQCHQSWQCCQIDHLLFSVEMS